MLYITRSRDFFITSVLTITLHFHVKLCKFVLQSVQSSDCDTIPKISPKPCFSALLFGLPFLLNFLQRIFHRTNIHYSTHFLIFYVYIYHFCIKNNPIRHFKGVVASYHNHHPRVSLDGDYDTRKGGCRKSKIVC